MGRYVDLERCPLMREEWERTFERMREHPDAPRRNCECGDRLYPEDLAAVRAYAATLAGGGAGRSARDLGFAVGYARALAPRSPLIAAALGGRTLPADWDSIPTSGRADVRDRLAELAPTDESAARIIVNPTSGTTGEPVRVPSHPRAQGCYDPLIDAALASRGVVLPRGPGRVAGVQVCFQRDTIVYDAVHSYRDGAGFAKVNVAPGAWETSRAARWLRDMEPGFVSGDPVAFEALLELGLAFPTGALLSTATRLPQALCARLERAFACPVVNFYSANDSGPLGYSDPERPYDERGRAVFRPLPSDLYFEVADDGGRALPDGEAGTLLVSGGRNPFVPLLRYSTGDRATLGSDAKGPYLVLEGGREGLLFKLPSGGRLNPVDVARALRAHPVARHRVLAKADGSFRVWLECPGFRFARAAIERSLLPLFEGAPVELVDGFSGVDKGAPAYEAEK